VVRFVVMRCVVMRCVSKVGEDELCVCVTYDVCVCCVFTFHQSEPCFR
jgi:hypothetical protein